MPEAKKSGKYLKDKKWKLSYKTSSTMGGDAPVDILHDFYIPVLKSSVEYNRVAGYFRSSSLAAASQGFSSFVNSGGKMRLVVGADLDENDVSAILQADSKRMADLLNRELDHRETWPENVVQGVELLSWMVAQGFLEVRVAFRVHKDTGKPLAFTSSEDGYVHEKWAVFKDQKADRLYITGSLNESKTALMLNAENIDVHADWWNDIEKLRVDEAQIDFENIWKNKSPYLRVMGLPEAVKKRLITIAKSAKKLYEIDGTEIINPSSSVNPFIAPPSAMELLCFALIKDAPKLPRGRYVGMETAPVKAWPHQDVTARRLIETWPYSYLLCDEVGLGKTIEAGLAFRSLYLSGMAKRILISPPASLVDQWQREMASKFLLPFARTLSGSDTRHQTIFPGEETRTSKGLLDPDLCIISTGLLSRAERQNEIRSARSFDIAFVDEAHYARRKNSKNGHRVQPRFGNLYKTIKTILRQKSKALLLATATPMQIDWIEVFDLINLTNRVGQFQEDPSLTWAYYEILGAIVADKDVPEDLWKFLKNSIAFLDRYDPFYKKYLEIAVIDSRIKNITRQWLERDRIPRGRDRTNIQKLIFSSAPLSRVMLRHTRPLLEIYREKGQLGANLAKRTILPVPKIVLNALERRAYDELEVYCRELVSKISANRPANKPPPSLGFLLSFLRLRLASSLFAIKETLRRRKKRVIATLNNNSNQSETPDFSNDVESYVDSNDESDKEIDHLFLKDRETKDLEWEKSKLSEMLHTLRDLSASPSKFRELLNVFDQRKFSGRRIKQLVIFTRFYDTLTDIVTRIRRIDSSMRIGTYSGKGGQYVDIETNKLKNADREEIRHRFMGEEIDVLICTDAAAEGLNLQTADLIINYDLPWNPMKVEQRIGRIDRIGQKYDEIFVLNLCYADSAEQIVYDRLLKRLVQAGDIVGTQQVAMLPVSIEEFNDLAAGEITPEQLETIARERIMLQNKRRQTMEIPARELYEIYIRLNENRGDKISPVTLDSIWQAITQADFLKDRGCKIFQDQSNSIIQLSGLPGIPEGTCLTTDRKVFEKGGRNSPGRLHFGSFGDPVFDELLRIYEKFELPDCIMRLSNDIPDINTEMVAYAVGVTGINGQPGFKLIIRWSDLKNIEIDESADLSKINLGPLKKQLHHLIREEFDPTRAVKRLENSNFKAAIAQKLFNLICIRALLLPIGADENDNFWTIAKSIEDHINEKEQLMAPKCSVKLLTLIQNHLLADVKVPSTGEYATITLPIHFVASALDEAYRVADAIKTKKIELSVGMVLSKINREIKKHVGIYQKNN